MKLNGKAKKAVRFLARMAAIYKRDMGRFNYGSEQWNIAMNGYVNYKSAAKETAYNLM